MQREFSKELAEDRQFEIGGELFEWMYPHWTVMAEWYDEGQQVNTNGDETPAFSLRADTEFAIEKIPLFLNPKNESHKRFKAMVARKTDPVPRHQIAQLYRWLINVTSGLPTNPPLDSESGGGDSAESSVEESSSQGETPTA